MLIHWFSHFSKFLPFHIALTAILYIEIYLNWSDVCIETALWLNETRVSIIEKTTKSILWFKIKYKIYFRIQVEELKMNIWDSVLWIINKCCGYIAVAVEKNRKMNENESCIGNLWDRLFLYLLLLRFFFFRRVEEESTYLLWTFSHHSFIINGNLHRLSVG